ncbi:MAG: NAD(P)-binding domain-containing protein [Rhodoglobus sp.]
MTTIGFIGSGNIGSQLARKAIENGYDVVLSNSRGPETLDDLVAELGPKARAATPAEAAAAADFAVVTVPFKAYLTVPVAELAGKVVIDTNNYYFERDGHVDVLDRGEHTVSGMLQEHLPTSKVVKAFNHITSADITAASRPAGDPARRALAIAGDDESAKATVTAFQDEVGFDTVNAGTLAESWRFDRDMPAYGSKSTAAQMHVKLHEATR